MDGQIQLHTVLVRDGLAEDLDDLVVVMDLESGEYCALADLAAELWRQMERPVRASDLLESVIASYEVGPARAKRDLLAFLNHLAQKKLVTIPE